MSERNRAVGRAYYERNHRCALVHRTEQRVEAPANVERREFSEPCFLCGQREGCAHR